MLWFTQSWRSKTWSSRCVSNWRSEKLEEKTLKSFPVCYHTLSLRSIWSLASSVEELIQNRHGHTAPTRTKPLRQLCQECLTSALSPRHHVVAEPSPPVSEGSSVLHSPAHWRQRDCQTPQLGMETLDISRTSFTSLRCADDTHNRNLTHRSL